MGSSLQKSTNMREAYGLKAKESPAWNPVATTQLHEGERPGMQQFNDAAYPFRDERNAYGLIDPRYPTAVGPMATTQMYEGERPGMQQFNDAAYPVQQASGSSL